MTHIYYGSYLKGKPCEILFKLDSVNGRRPYSGGSLQPNTRYIVGLENGSVVNVLGGNISCTLDCVEDILKEFVTVEVKFPDGGGNYLYYSNLNLQLHDEVIVQVFDTHKVAKVVKSTGMFPANKTKYVVSKVDMDFSAKLSDRRNYAIKIAEELEVAKSSGKNLENLLQEMSEEYITVRSIIDKLTRKLRR